MLGKYNVIDLGSSSVRLLQVENGVTIQKKGIVCRLAENKVDNCLNKESMLRTAKVVKDFVKEARDFGGEIYVFATASLRNSRNGQEFANYLKDLTGQVVEIVSGEEEAEIGLIGALQGKDGAVLDIGGASSEIIVAKNKKIVYEKSLPLGGVVLKTLSGDSLQKASVLAEQYVTTYGEIPKSEFVGIGGTVTCATAVALGLKQYDSNVVNGHKLTYSQVLYVEEYLQGKTVQQIAEETCVSLKRAEILPYGLQILKAIFNRLELDYITISESDNLEGFLLKKEGVRYEKR